MDEEEIINKWASCGFLDQLTNEQKRTCSLLFESVAQYIVSDTSGKYDNIETNIFPTIYRIIKQGGIINDPIMFTDYYSDWWRRDRVINVINNLLSQYPGVDVEFEMVSLFTEEYLTNDFKKDIRPKRGYYKHKL